MKINIKKKDMTIIKKTKRKWKLLKKKYLSETI